ncbi:MAG: DNA polymerase/3'-5' exonuclease PolX [Saprospiraceae bacterium]|nr:DNA polymerase/3'-5' exonuclease PolX [Saprospiraceae bacterium]
MTNKQIAYAFDDLANLMELHEEDDFRIRSYRNAYLNLRKLDAPLEGMSDADIKNIKGVGPAIASKIRELLGNGRMTTLEQYREKTPPGVVEMLEVNGFGPKKVRVVWKDMGIETVGELWYACNENRLIEFKGFGLKTQEDLQKKLEYFFKSRDKLRLDAAFDAAEQTIQWLRECWPSARIETVGDLRRTAPVVSQVELLAASNEALTLNLEDSDDRSVQSAEGGGYKIRIGDNATVWVHTCQPDEWGSKQFKLTGSREFVEQFVRDNAGVDFRNLPDETAVFERSSTAFVWPEQRDLLPEGGQPPILPKAALDITLRGVLHIHTTWSDGLHSLRDMCEYARSLGYAYIGITDHSQSAFYANGLKADRVVAQWAEIDALNQEMAPFRILKGIESDILNDGSLDYPDDILAGFDFVIASVHSNLKMAIEKATERVVRAIENPYTTILGHPTGRLLLSREGYPLDWTAVMDACQKHGVAIELNANPHRLDIDWTLIPEAMRRGIKISINPDAHSREGIHDVKYGLMVARKGGLTAAHCLNAGDVSNWLKR